MRAALVTAVAVLALAAPALAAEGRTETPVPSAAEDAAVVSESYVTLPAPLPEGAGPHPAACDRIGYLRFRRAGGPANASDADAVITLIPGIFAGAGSLDPVARHVVRLAADRGRNFEVWAIDRRSACLEDHFGTQAALRAHDVRPAFDYYYNGKEVDGHKFKGFVPPSDAEFMREFGLGLTVRDWHEVITREMPDRSVRQKKMICGGHSLGGPLTAALASWDFDGNPETTNDAGYLDCAALAGLDTTVSLNGKEGGPAGVGIASEYAARSGASPYVNAPPFEPPIEQLPPIAATAAFRDPAKESVFNQLIPRDPDFELTLRLLFSKDAAQFASGQPSIRDFRLDNATILAGIFDDNSAGISILRASMGISVGGPFADKNFPAPDPTLALPEEPKGPLYKWVGYDAVGTPAAGPIPENDEGEPYTTRESEVTDVREFARTFFAAPADFVEQYFPTRLASDFAAAEGGDRSGDLANLRYDGPSMRPILLVTAGDSDNNANAPDDGAPHDGERPNDKPHSRDVVLPGYNHLDVADAAWKQNDGRLEPSSAALVDFALAVTGASGAVKGTRASGCLPQRAKFTARGLAPIRLRARRAAVIKRAGRPANRKKRAASWCVTGTARERAIAVFDKRGRVIAAASTAGGHRWHGLGVGSRAKRLHARRIARGLYVRAAGKPSVVAFAVRNGRVRLVMVTGRSLGRKPAALRRASRAALAVAR